MNPTEKPILILDSEDIVLLALSETVTAMGYKVKAFTSAAKALQQLTQEEFSVILSDLRIAEMSGLDFLKEAKKHQPNAPRILVTGILKPNMIIDSINEAEIFRFIAKPWARADITAAIKEAVNRFNEKDSILFS